MSNSWCTVSSSNIDPNQVEAVRLTAESQQTCNNARQLNDLPVWPEQPANPFHGVPRMSHQHWSIPFKPRNISWTCKVQTRKVKIVYLGHANAMWSMWWPGNWIGWPNNPVAKCESQGECWWRVEDCYDRDRTYPCSSHPDLPTSFPSRQNHPQAPNATPEPSGSIPSQLTSLTHSQTLWPPCVSTMHSWHYTHSRPNPMLPQPFLFLASSWFPTSTLIPNPTPFNLHSSASSLFPTFHRSRDCGRAKPDHVPSSLNVS